VIQPVVRNNLAINELNAILKETETSTGTRHDGLWYQVQGSKKKRLIHMVCGLNYISQ